MEAYLPWDGGEGTLHGMVGKGRSMGWWERDVTWDTPTDNRVLHGITFVKNIETVFMRRYTSEENHNQQTCGYLRGYRMCLMQRRCAQ